MHANNRLTRDFVSGFPAEAARVLDELEAQSVVACLLELDAEDRPPILALMSPKAAARCVVLMPAELAARIIEQIEPEASARIIQLLERSARKPVAALVGKQCWSRIQRFLAFPPGSAGALMDSHCTVLFEDTTVARAIKKLEQDGRRVGCEIFVVSAAHRLVGVMELGRLMFAGRNRRVGDLADSRPPAVSAESPASALVGLPAWRSWRRLAVTDGTNTFLGALDRFALETYLSDTRAVTEQDPLAIMLALARLYCLSVMRLLEGVLAAGRPRHGRRK